ncbi:tandem-95 repeat protein [Trichocoleus desertorum AS-A10]|uniref:tandem-95 repeat protein n=1 Tax=Trichocoleus desertorum TaxID=1481672 RepID=UPI0032970937
MTSLNEAILADSLVLAQQQLQGFAQSENFWTVLDSVFGTEYDRTQTEAIQQAWQANDFSLLPEIQVVDATSMSGIQGGFSAQTGKIYINADFLANATTDQIAAVLLEEIGHSLDSRINVTDAGGDEGQLFSALVGGQSLSEEQLVLIQSQNDGMQIVVDGLNISVEAAATVVNGNFETGNLNGWTVVNQSGSSGSFYIQNGQSSPYSGFSVPSSGSYAAMADQGSPGSHLLYQDIYLSADGLVPTLNFSLFIGNRAEAFYTPNSMSYSTYPNQQFRVDLLNPSFSNFFGTATDGVLANVFQTIVGSPAVFSNYQSYSFNLTPFAGSTVRLAFRSVETNYFFQVGVDNVAINSVNVAPVLADSSIVFNSVNEDSGIPIGAVGTLVSQLADLVGGAGQSNVTDAAPGAVTGIAITNTDTANGTWFYSTNNGVTWNSLSGVSNASARLLAADANTRIYFQPNPNFNGAITNTIQFRAWDRITGTNGGTANTNTNGGLTSFSVATDTASITVNPVNDTPVVANAIADQTVSEDTAFSFTIPANTFSDVDGDTLAYSAKLVDDSDLPSWLIFDPTTRTFSGTPENSDVDSLSVKVIAADASGTTAKDIFTLAISNTNDAPTLDATTTSISYTDSSNDDSFDVVGGELTSTDPDVGDTATYGITEGDDNNDGTISKTGLYGTLTVDKETGAYTFTPNDDAIEALKADSSEAFTLLVTDGSGATATQKLTIDLTGVNDTASISGTQTGSVTEDITVIDGALTASGTLSVSDRDTGDAKFSTTVTPAGSVLGSLTITEAGAWAYNVDNSAVQSLGQNVTKLEKFTVTSIDSTATQEITVTITGTNDAPTGSPTVTLTSGTEDTAYTINKADLLAGFSDVDGDSFSVSNLTANDVVLTADSNGNYVFTPPANFNGSVTLNYNVVDGKGGSRAATQSFALAPVNDAAVLSSANVALSETNAVLSTSGKLSISDVDNTAEFVAQADVAGSYGQFSIDKDGNWSYAANEAYNSLNVGDSVADTFTVKTVDGTASSVQVTINGTNDAPTATNDSLITSEDIPLVISAATLIGNDVDVDLGDILSVSEFTQPSQGGLVDNGNGTYTYTPNANYNGVDSFAYTMRDREGATSTATVNLTVNAVNDNPDAINDIITARQGTAKTILAADLLANDADIEGDALRLTQVKNAQNGTVALDSNGNVVFTANANVATASFEYTLSDGQGGTDIAFVSVLVGVVDDGGNGQDTMNGTAGDDVLNGGNGDDILRGFSGDDKLLGGNGIDNLQGGEGKDWLYGGRSNDLLNGGLGRDTFVLISQNGTDTIQDFTDGEDQIGLAEGLTFGQLTVSSSNGNTLIAKNGGDVLAILSGVNSSLITQADFISVV